MMEEGKKINFYRLGLENGKRYRMGLTDEYRLTGTGGGVFLYLAPVYDSRDQDGSWHRLVLEGDFYRCKYEVLVMATNEDLTEQTEKAWEEGSSPDLFWPEGSYVRKVNTDDFLLHELKGRYLWVLIRISGAAVDSHFCIEGFRVEFPWTSFSGYLPEIYQEAGQNSFFERYMAVFQSMYEDLEQQVDHLPRILDYESTPDENLETLLMWTGKPYGGAEPGAEKIRTLIRDLSKIQTGKGTVRVMKQMIQFVTGRDAVIMEYFKWHDWMRRGASQLERYEKLFGKNEDQFCVILDLTREGQPVVPEELQKLLQEYTPLGMNSNLIFLDWSSQMDTHCYLDKNSRLAIPERADTSGFSLDGNYVLG
ncbi:hypothetical protein DXA90_02725 [Clostridiaceae bacterium OF09-1]|nr:hypothetical protein DXA90_02725 [Clostridiaceae bacterium OF09-1]